MTKRNSAIIVAAPSKTLSRGKKNDQGKDEWSLVPWSVMREVVQVLMHGARKYSPDNWMRVEPKERYFDAAMRHLIAWKEGERCDPETGRPHLAHAICSLLFLTWKDSRSLT